MVNLKDENKRQSDTIKEGTEKFLDQQKQQMANTTSNISDTILTNINSYYYLTIFTITNLAS
jgi:hypothetical protein